MAPVTIFAIPHTRLASTGWKGWREKRAILLCHGAHRGYAQAADLHTGSRPLSEGKLFGCVAWRRTNLGMLHKTLHSRQAGQGGARQGQTKTVCPGLACVHTCAASGDPVGCWPSTEWCCWAGPSVRADEAMVGCCFWEWERQGRRRGRGRLRRGPQTARTLSCDSRTTDCVWMFVALQQHVQHARPWPSPSSQSAEGS